MSAAAEPISVLGQINLPIQLRDVKVDHSFVLVQSLITPVTLGIDFMQKHGLVLDFTTTPITISIQTIHVNCQPDHDLEPLLSAMRKVKLKVAAIPMLQGIIEPSSSPWMAPASFIHKTNGEVRIQYILCRLQRTKQIHYKRCISTPLTKHLQLT